MALRLLTHTTNSPAADLALEEALHLCVEEDASPNTWRLWSARDTAVILGTGQEAAREANLDAAQAENISVLRRHSGGGAVVIGPGTINFSAFFRNENLPGSQTIQGAMRTALATVIDTLNAFGLKAQMAGLSDLAVLSADGTLRKIAGNSQARKRRSVVVHGTLLADPDWARIGRLLKFPSSIPEYRAGRPHTDFLTSLKQCGAPFSFDEYRAEFAKRLPNDIDVMSMPSPHEAERAKILLAEKYSLNAWNFRR